MHGKIVLIRYSTDNMCGPVDVPPPLQNVKYLYKCVDLIIYLIYSLDMPQTVYDFPYFLWELCPQTHPLLYTWESVSTIPEPHPSFSFKSRIDPCVLLQMTLTRIDLYLSESVSLIWGFITFVQNNETEDGRYANMTTIFQYLFTGIY